VNSVHPDAVALIKAQELFMAEPYMDHGKPPRLAQGYGHSIGPPEVGGVWTEEYASDVLLQDIEDRAKPLRKWLKDSGDIQLTDRQFGACISLIYNRGWTAFLKTKVAEFILSTNVTNHMIKAGCAFVEEENMRSVDKDTGEPRVFLGLKRRRILEAAMFLTQGD
jgi:GH24 family phage-related lysozyme (muramidase)